MKKNRLNFILPHTFYKCGDKIYSEKPYFYEELKKYFDLRIYCNIKLVSKDYIINNDLIPLKNISFFHFFEKLSLSYFLLNYFTLRKKLLGIQKTRLDKFFVYFPHLIYSLIVAFILRNQNLTIWVRNNPIEQFTVHGNFFQRLFRKLIKPFIFIFYNLIIKIIFKNNLIFYTGNITHQKNNHINQHELISCFPFNNDKRLIHKLENKQLNIMFVGGEERRKGIFLLLRATSNLSFKIKINFIGIDKFRDYENIKFSKNLDIVFYGKVNSRKKFYELLSANDLLVMPSYGERQGKVQLEAMSVGVVPICSDSGGTYRTIDNYYNGLLFKEGDWKDLKEKIELLYQDQELYKDLQQNGLEFISELSVEKQVKKMSKIINNYYRKNGKN